MKRRLGQHFLDNPAVISRIIQAAQLEPHDLVVEIGPGHGKMTKMLAEKAGRVIAIELDERLYDRLKRDLAGFGNIDLILADAMEFDYGRLPDFKVVANIPYYVTTPILFRLLDARRNLCSMTLTIQKEVAERIVASPGGKDYGVLSIMVQYYAATHFAFVIPGEAFRPVPKVDSAVVHIRLLDRPSVEVRNEQLFFRIVKTAFSQRRKMLSNSLKGMRGDPKEWLHKAAIDPDRRPESLHMEEFARLADILSDMQPE